MASPFDIKAQTEELGRANPYSRTLKVKTGPRGRPGMYSGEEAFNYRTVENPYYIDPDKAREETLRQAEARYGEFKAQQDARAAATQADIAKQLKIVQEEKSAVSKMMTDYSDMLIREAEARKKAQEEERLALRTDRANLARAGKAGSLQIQPAGSTPRTAGTQQFRRRATQFGGGTPYTGLSQISSGMVNV